MNPAPRPSLGDLTPNGPLRKLDIDPIAFDDVGGRSMGLSGETVGTPHVTVPSPLAGPDLTIDMIVQLDDLTKAKHVLITTELWPADLAGQLP
jgi:hypothetical protein